MRGSDAGHVRRSLVTLWVGLLYDDAALSAAEALVRGMSWRTPTLRNAVRRRGLGASFRTGTLRDRARDVVAIAHDGLRA